MAIPQLALLFIGTLAVLASAGVFVRFGDATELVVPFAAALLWAVFAISAFDVDLGTPEAVPILPLVYLGVGYAIVTGLVGIGRLLGAFREEVPA